MSFIIIADFCSFFKSKRRLKNILTSFVSFGSEAKTKGIMIKFFVLKKKNKKRGIFKFI